MQILELNLDIIKYICDKLDLGDLAMFSSRCQSLREFYPSVEANQRGLKKQVMADICSMMYECDDGVSNRIADDEYVTYSYCDNNNVLTIEYCNVNGLTDEFIAKIDARPYKGNIKYRKFNVTYDRANWTINACGHIEMKRNAIAGGTHVVVYAFDDSSIEIEIDSRYRKYRGADVSLPVWVDYNDTDFWKYPK